MVELVAPGVVNTMPESTLDAFADHGELRGDTAASGYDEARKLFADLEDLGIGYDDVTAVLETEGVEKFSASWAELLGAIEKEMIRVRGSSSGQANRQ